VGDPFEVEVDRDEGTRESLSKDVAPDSSHVEALA
jgi:hypothetical protein